MHPMTAQGARWLLPLLLALPLAGPALGQSAKPGAAAPQAASPPAPAKPEPLPSAGAPPTPGKPPQATAQASPPPAAPTQCPDDFEAYRDSGESLTCLCPAEATGRGAVWGTDVYTTDSSICRAAVHAGVIPRRGGEVTVIPEAGRNAYPGTTRNGFASTNYGRYATSFRFQPAAGAAPAGGQAAGGQAAAAGAPAAPSQCPDDFVAYKDTDEPLTCACPAEATGRGAVWGTDVYTGDSAVCRAAVHAGAIRAAGGLVVVTPEPGRGAYPGTTRNGFASNNYGRYDHSFRVQAAGPGGARPAQAAAAGPSLCPDNFDAFRDTDETLACLCPAEATSRGALWGTDTYTADSGICRAAVHAGVIPRTGGPVTVVPQPGRNAYPGTTRNGIASNNYGAYRSSFRFDAPAQRVAMGAPVQAPVAESLRATGKVALYVTFRTGSADLDISAAGTLGELRDALQADPSLRLVLIGHTDNTGTPQGNVGLSQRRAEAVRAWLIAQGIAADRLSSQGRGQTEPVAENTSESGRALNRRVQAERR